MISISGIAQKLPNVQQVSLRAPANVKIDGKASEWGDVFQAYNPATDLHYTIANDDKKLYLIAQSDIQMAVSRIMLGGITLIVQPSGQKSDKGAPLVSFPVYEKDKRRPNVTLRDKKELPRASKEVSDRFADSLMKENNRKLAAGTKWIGTRNITGADTIISIYNDAGIQAAHAVDNKRTYTCEIAIELKKLGISAENIKKFTYHILINGGPNKFPMVTAFAATGPDGRQTPAELIDQLNNISQQLTATTDFWGEYTLAK